MPQAERPPRPKAQRWPEASYLGENGRQVGQGSSGREIWLCLIIRHFKYWANFGFYPEGNREHKSLERGDGPDSND